MWITRFEPDHVASTTQTLTSTSSKGNASSRTMSSAMSVLTFEAFFGHDPQIIPFRTVRFLA